MSEMPRRDFLKLSTIALTGKALGVKPNPNPKPEQKEPQQTLEPICLTSDPETNTFIKKYSKENRDQIDKEGFIASLYDLTSKSPKSRWGTYLTNEDGSHTFQLAHKEGKTVLTEVTKTDNVDEDGNPVMKTNTTYPSNLEEVLQSIKGDQTLKLDSISFIQDAPGKILQIDLSTFSVLNGFKNDADTYIHNKQPNFNIPRLSNPLKSEARVTIDITFGNSKTKNQGEVKILNSIFFSNPSNNLNLIIIQRMVAWKQPDSPPKEKFSLGMTSYQNGNNEEQINISIENQDKLTRDLFRTTIKEVAQFQRVNLEDFVK